MKFKLLIVIALSLFSTCCKRQDSKNELPPTTSTKKTEESKPSAIKNEYSLFTDYNSQISQVVRTIFQDSNGILWFGTENGAFKLNGDVLTHIDEITSENGKGVTVKEIAESKDGKIWIGHKDGVSSIDGSYVKNYNESHGLLSKDVWSIAADKNGKIWIGTIDGISTFNGKRFTTFILPDGDMNSKLGISSKRIVHSIFEDSKGTIWFSSNAGLFSYANNLVTNVSEKLGIQTNFINEIFEDKKGELWISTNEGLYHLKHNKAKNVTKGKIEIGKGIGSIGEDKVGNIWFVSNQHDLFKYQKGKLIKYIKTEDNKGPVVFQIFKDQNQRLWFVGFGGAFRLENDTFVNVTKNGPW